MKHLHPEVEKKFLPYMKELLTIYKNNVLSVFIFGSAATENYKPASSDINSCFVFKNIEFSQLKQSLKIIQKGMKKKITAPLLLTKDYILESLDVFPIEFLDMKEAHITVHGEEILNTLDIKGEHIRLFCEQQIKGKLIRIRQAFLEIGLSKKGIETLIKDSLNSLFPVFRNLLRLKGIEPSINKKVLIDQLCNTLSLDANVWMAIYTDKENDEKIAGKDATIFVERYIQQIEKLANEVDKL